MRILLNEKFILLLIIINALVIFSQGFTTINDSIGESLALLDIFITIIFIIEAIVKIYYLKSNYFITTWNIFDFILVLTAVPSVISYLLYQNTIDVDFLLAIRVLRVFKFLRVLKFIPNVVHILKGIKLAIRSSVFIILAFFIFNFIFSLLSYSFYSNLLPEYYGNPLISFYSTFKIFTIEGWYEIPDLIAEKTDSALISIMTRVYFVILLFGGGIFGLSLINSIFVDSMMSDNNDELIEKINTLEKKIDQIINNK